MYDLSNPSDVIKQLKDADMTDEAALKTLELAVQYLKEEIELATV